MRMLTGAAALVYCDHNMGGGAGCLFVGGG